MSVHGRAVLGLECLSFWYVMSLQPATFFFPTDIFILLRQTAWAQAEEYFPRRLQRKQSEHIKLSAPFPDVSVWVNRSGHCWQIRGMRWHTQEENLGLSLRKASGGDGNAYVLWSQPHCCPYCQLCVSFLLFPLTLLKTPQDAPNCLWWEPIYICDWIIFLGED